ncbi:MAG: hypothetical protein K2N56_04610 [Oscillospiraceae bacterium]|nr:hypothetical protein [Oscillospiraceae bacterium]
MKVMRKFAALCTVFGLLIALSGCAGSGRGSDSGDMPSGDSSEVYDEGDLLMIDIRKNSVVSVYNAKSEVIGSFDCCDYSTLVNGSILYTKALENAPEDDRLEYWLYNIETGENHKLGVVDKSYEAVYEQIEFNNHLYLSISTGQYGVLEDMGLTIYDIDLLNYSISPILEVEQAFPYNSFTIANNKLVLAELLHNGHTDLVEYDLNEKSSSPVVHKYDESDEFVPDSIRHIYADSEYIYTVRLHHGEAENYSLYLDKYDFDHNLLNTVDISNFCVSTDTERTEFTKINEWKQFIAYFFVHDDLIYYQNFSTTNAIGVINNDKIDRLFNIDALFSYVISVSEGDGGDLFAQLYENSFYLVDPQTHEVKTAEFFADDHRYTFEYASRDGDKILLLMRFVRKESGDETLPDRLYYIDMNDLDFKPMG